MAYNWQCLSGHSGEIPQGSPLETKAINRAEEGFIDAICLSFEQCPECVADQIEYLRCEVRYCSESGCSMDESACAQGCMAAMDLRELEDVYVL
ncbi:MAG: hypothetical protein HYT98_00585 [Candidatus Sungbacteria bacterium]|nr:hypothetical protein [Candidatus Sungbacteria bacterium]